MPLYDFACKNEKCINYNEDLEKICKVGEIPDCENCGTPLKKLIKAPKTRQIPHVSWSQWRAI